MKKGIIFLVVGILFLAGCQQFANISANNVVTIAQLKIPDAGFAVVYKSLSGNLGPVLGTSDLLPAGVHNNLAIPLVKGNPGSAVIVQLHADTNNNGIFDPIIDRAVKVSTSDSDSTIPVRVILSTTITPSTVTPHQTRASTTVAPTPASSDDVAAVIVAVPPSTDAFT